MVAPRIVKLFSITVLVAFLISSVEPKGEEKPKEEGKGKDGCLSIKAASNEPSERVIVLFKKNEENAAKNHYEMMTNCYGKKIERVSSGRVGVSSIKNKDTIRDFSTGTLQGYTANLTPSFIEAVEKMDNVALVEKTIKFKTTYAVPRYLNRRAVDNNPTDNIDRIDQAKRPTDGKYVFPDEAGEGVNIFVVDTGVLTTHSEFGGRAKFGGSFCTGCNDDDENGHGTHVSSIAAGKTLGVARKANIIGVRVLDANGAGDNGGVIEGLSFVLDQHNKGKNKNSVVNMSLGGTFSQAVNDAVSKLTDAGIHVAVAAGNDGENACKSSPASEPTAVTVGATEDDNDDVTDFSNDGKCVDIFAPGRNIKGASIKSNNDNAVFSGTSQATPHVAGTMALIISQSGNLSPDGMAEELNKLSTKGVIKNLSNGSPDSFLRVPAP